MRIAICLLGLMMVGSVSAVEHWPQWRGPNHNGVSDAKELPTTWSQTENIVWKAPLPAWSGGTPVIWGDRIFLTSPSKTEQSAEVEQREEQQPDQRRRRRGGFGGPRRDPGGQKLLLICVSKKDGSTLWERELDEGNQLHQKHNNTSPSPVTDGKRVWVVTGTGVVTAFDVDGNQIWSKDLQEMYGRFGLNWGYASSPLLYDGKLIVEVLHGHRTDDPSYIVAFNPETGETLWRQERDTDAVAESPDAYTTPAVFQSGEATHIVISGGDYVTGHDPKTGAEIWRTAGLNPDREGNYRVVGSPVVVDGLIYTPTRKKPLLALRVDASGEVATVWKWEGSGAPDVPTPVSDGVYFYMVDDRGLATCVDAKSGEPVWGPERTAQGTVSASPILADGKLYIVNEDAVTTVLEAGPAFKHVATNELDGSYTLSSPVVSGSQLFVRTGTHLYCIGAGSQKQQ